MKPVPFISVLWANKAGTRVVLARGGGQKRGKSFESPERCVLEVSHVVRIVPKVVTWRAAVASIYEKQRLPAALSHWPRSVEISTRLWGQTTACVAKNSVCSADSVIVGAIATQLLPQVRFVDLGFIGLNLIGD